jgi:hypothetical protein
MARTDAPGTSRAPPFAWNTENRPGALTLPVLIPSGHSRLLWGKRNPERLGRLLGEHHLLYRGFLERDVSRPLAAEYASEDLRCGLTGLIPADADGEERAPLYEPLFPRLRDLCRL